MTKQQKIKDETNKLMDRCYTKGSSDYPGLMVFQRQKFLNELFPLLGRLGVAIRVDPPFRIVRSINDNEIATGPLIRCSSCKKEPCECPSINRGSFAKYVEEG